MSKPVPAGVRGQAEETVTLALTLQGHRDSLPPVYSTPDMIRLMEIAAATALQPYAEGDEITVGTHIDVRHNAACGIGAKVHAEAVLESSDERFYIMRVRAWAEENGRTFDIGRGTVNRAFVSVGKFLERLKARGA